MEINFKIDFEYNGIFTVAIDGSTYDSNKFVKSYKGDIWIEANMLDLKMEDTTEISLIDLLENFEAVEAKEGIEAAQKWLKETKDTLFLTYNVSVEWRKQLNDYLENHAYDMGYVGSYKIKDSIFIDYEVKDINIFWGFENKIDLPESFEKILTEKHSGIYKHVDGNNL